MVSAIFPVIQGVGYSLASNEAKRLEDSVKAGGNNYLTAMLQMGQGSKALDFIDKANVATTLPLPSWTGRSIVYLTPILLAVLKNSKVLPEKTRPTLVFLHNHLGTFYQVTAIVSSIALLFFGQIFFAVPSLIVLGIGIMDRNGWLPIAFRQFLHRYNRPLLIVTGLVSGGLLDRIFAIVNLLSWCVNLYLSQKINLHKRFALKENLSSQKIDDLFNGRLNLKINPSFIYYNPFPSIPNIDIHFFIQQFDQIKWEQHLLALREKLRHDARFVERHQTPDLKSDEEIISITRASLQAFIQTVKERRILEGEPVDYEKLHNYLKLIAKYFEDQNDEITRTDIIFRLAVEGGEYCGPGKFEVIESVYAQTIGENPNIPFKDKVIYCFQNERNLWMQKFHSMIFSNDSMSQIGQIIDWQDVHNYNLFMNLYGDEFGLQKAAADNDDMAFIDPIIKLFVLYALKEKIHTLFWNDHDLKRHTQILIDAIGTEALPKDEFYAFWLDWIKKQEMEDAVKEMLIEELSEGKLYNRQLEINGKLTPEFVILMLLDMGIVEIESTNAADSNPINQQTFCKV